MAKFCNGLLLVATLLVPAMACAESSMFGEVELNYLDFSSRSASDGSFFESQAFTQRYVAGYMVTSRNPMKSRKPLEYNFELGYEWLALDKTTKTEGGEENPSLRNGRLFYRGEVDYDPPTMPLSLKVYAKDFRRSMITTTTIGNDRSIIQMDMPHELRSPSGIHLQSGATLVFGEKRTLGNRYGELFSHIPLIFVDYSQTIEQDSRQGIDSLTREFALVSLNKKDNWFHYRSKTFEDFITPKNNWERTEYQLGTVDQVKSRRWVELTNWISISTDAQLIRMQAQDKAAEFDEYNLNLFSLAARRSWQLRVFSSFSRRKDASTINVERSLPVYLSGLWGADTDWSANISYKDTQSTALTGGLPGFTAEEEHRGVVLRATTLKRALFTVSPLLSVQHSAAGGGKTLDLLGRVEVASTGRFSARHQLDGSYNIRAYLENGNAAGSGTGEYVKQELRGRWSYYLNDRLRGTLQQEFQSSKSLNNGPLTSEYEQATTYATLGWVPNSVFSSSLSATNEYARIHGVGTNSRQNLSLAVDAKSNVLRASFTSTLDYAKQASGSENVTSFLNGFIDYNPVKYYSSRLNARYSINRVSGQDAGSSYELKLLSRYDYYPKAFTGKPLVQLEKEFSYVDSSASDPSAWVRFMVRYYPTSRLSLVGSSTFNLIGDAQQVYSLSANINAKYFQTSVDYSYGRRSSDQRVDKRLSTSIRRAF